jgi:hypothetical protein
LLLQHNLLQNKTKGLSNEHETNTLRDDRRRSRRADYVGILLLFAVILKGLVMTYKTEFPDFVLDVTIPAGFEDNSYHNDVCPHFTKDIGASDFLCLWVDFANPSEREYSGHARFTAERVKDGDQVAYVTSDNWQDIVDFVETF